MLIVTTVGVTVLIVPILSVTILIVTIFIVTLLNMIQEIRSSPELPGSLVSRFFRRLLICSSIVATQFSSFTRPSSVLLKVAVQLFSFLLGKACGF